MHRWARRLLLGAAIVELTVAVGFAIVRADEPVPGAAKQAADVPDVATTSPTVPAGPWAPLTEPAGSGVVVTPTGVLVPVVAAHEDGTYEVRTPCDAPAVVTGTPLVGAHVVLDPGHGGDEPGAVGPNGLLEKDLNLAVAQRTAEVLRRAGATVVLTRDTDLRVTIATRAAIAVGLHPVAFLSIHHNAAPEGSLPMPGTQVYFQYASPDSRRLAGLVVEEVRAALAPYGAPWVGDALNGGRARIIPETGEDFYGVLRRAAGVTSALSEAAYLSDPVEADLFAREDVQQAEAEALARALTRFVMGEAPAESAFAPGGPSTEPSGGGGGGTAGCVDPPLG